MSVRIKICGVSRAEDALYAAELGAFALGFIFYPKSPRCVRPKNAGEIVKLLPQSVWKVGVFVNSSREEVERAAEIAGLTALQFHGDEGPEFLSGWGGLKVIKALRLGSETEHLELSQFAECSDYLLFDRFEPERYGGTGKAIDEYALLSPEIKTLLPRAFLSGGITPENIREKVQRFPSFAVDVSSGVEARPGVKDKEKLSRLFCSVGGSS